MKQMPHPDIFGGFGIAQPKILLDAQEVLDAFVVEIHDPFFTDKLAVGDKGIDTLGTEQPYNSLNQSSSLFPVGAVKAQNQSCLDGQKRKYRFGNEVKVESVFGKNLCRRRRLESRSTPAGKADAILWRLTVCTTQRA